MISDGGRHGVVEVPDSAFRVSFEDQNGASLSPEPLFAGAHASCPYSKTLRGKATVTLTLD